MNYQLYSQLDSSEKVRYQALYLEIGGPSTITSLNYEMGLFQYNRLKLNARIGVGFTRLNDFYLNFNPDLTFPVGLNSTFLLSDKKKGTLSFELMGGNTFSTFIRANHNYQPEREFDSHGYISIGPSWIFTKGVYTRLTYCLLLENYKTPFHWGGLSIGYIFK